MVECGDRHPVRSWSLSTRGSGAWSGLRPPAAPRGGPETELSEYGCPTGADGTTGLRRVLRPRRHVHPRAHARAALVCLRQRDRAGVALPTIVAVGCSRCNRVDRGGRFKERLFRIALLLFAGVELLRVAEGLSGHVATGSLHDGLQLLWAVFLAAAGWRSSRAWVRWASLVVLIAAVPLRFWVLERLFGTSSVVSSLGPSDGPIQSAAGVTPGGVACPACRVPGPGC